MAAETIAWWLFGRDRDDWVSRFRTPRLQWHWLRTAVRVERSGRRG